MQSKSQIFAVLGAAVVGIISFVAGSATVNVEDQEGNTSQKTIAEIQIANGSLDEETLVYTFDIPTWEYIEITEEECTEGDEDRPSVCTTTITDQILTEVIHTKSFKIDITQYEECRESGIEADACMSVVETQITDKVAEATARERAKREKMQEYSANSKYASEVKEAL